jgi:prepilin-type N-terminal cleavage/methylation domain-containing protein
MMKNRGQKRGTKGFTLIEMLVVIGIIAVLSGALMAGFGRVTKAAQRAKATELVSQAAQALAIMRQKNDNMWPAVVSLGGGDGAGKGMVVSVAEKLAEFKLLSVACRNWDGKDYTPIGVSRFGVVDPWAEAVLKRNNNATIASKVPSGGTVQDHIIYFAVDKDGDGITEATVGGQQVSVRAEAIAWCAGADGKIAPYAQRSRSDDIYSWDKAKEKK